jgi:hypothetical protein
MKRKILAFGLMVIMATVLLGCQGSEVEGAPAGLGDVGMVAIDRIADGVVEDYFNVDEEDEITRVVAIAREGMGSRTYALLNDGNLYGWGRVEIRHDDGSSLFENQYTPVHILDDVAYMAGAPGGFMAVIRNDGSLWAWGILNMSAPREYQLDLGRHPVHIMDGVASFGRGATFTILSRSPRALTFICVDDNLWLWNPRLQSYPFQIMQNVYDVVGDGLSYYVIDSDSRLWRMWAADINLEEGVRPGYNIHHIMDNVMYVATGMMRDTWVLCNDGSLWGLQVIGKYFIIDDVATFGGNNRREWSRNDDFSIIRNDGSLWVNRFNHGTQQRETVHILDDVVAATVIAISDLSLAIRSDGSLWARDEGYHRGVRAVHTGGQFRYPVQIMDDVAKIYHGFGSAPRVLLNDGSLWALEVNFRLGNLSYVHIMDDVIDVFAGSFSGVYIVRSDGSLWGWSYRGFLGDGTDARHRTTIPVHILGGDPYAQLPPPGQSTTNQATSTTQPPLRQLPQEQIPAYITINNQQHSRALTTLTLPNANNADVGQLRYMINLTELHISGLDLTDLTPISYLPNLLNLTLTSIGAADLTPIGGLVNLVSLRIAHTAAIVDISPLASLVNLQSFAMSNIGVSDISAVAGMRSLRFLHISAHTSARISDISPLAELTNLRGIALNNQQITDISPLANLRNLGTNFSQVSLVNNPITDWSPVAHVENVTGRP